MNKSLIKFNLSPYAAGIPFIVLHFWKQSDPGGSQIMFCFMQFAYLLCGILISSMLRLPKEFLQTKPYFISSIVQLGIIAGCWTFYRTQNILFGCFLFFGGFWTEYMCILLVFAGIYLYQLFQHLELPFSKSYLHPSRFNIHK